MNPGDTVPNFAFKATNDVSGHLADYKGQNIVLYFYPKDSTPGCTTEGRDFRDAYTLFQESDTQVFGISRDSLKSHEHFKAKQNFPFELISDHDEALCTLFDVIRPKTMFGRLVRGIQRSTFLINREGVLVKEWRKVSVKGHVDEVLAAVKEI